MKFAQLFVYVVIFLLILNSILPMILINDFERIKILGFNVYNFNAVITFPIAFMILLRTLKSEQINTNKSILLWILFYALYQICIVLPLSISYYPSVIINTYFTNINIRLAFLFIPLFYWVMVKTNNYNSFFLIFDILTIFLFILSLYNYSQGIYSVTNTGSIRFIAGIAILSFACTLVNSLKFFGASNNRYIFAVISIIGLLLSNHRSVFLAVGIIFSISILIFNDDKFNKSKITTIILLLVVLIVVSQIESLSKLIIPRMQTTFNISDDNYFDRYYKSILAFETFLENPVNGTLLSGIYYKSTVVNEYNNWSPHNFVFDILASQGITGAMFILTFLIYIFKLGYKNRYDLITRKSFIILIYYVLVALANVTFLNQNTIVVLTLFSAIIIARNYEIVKIKHHLSELYIVNKTEPYDELRLLNPKVN